MSSCLFRVVSLVVFTYDKTLNNHSDGIGFSNRRRNGAHHARFPDKVLPFKCPSKTTIALIFCHHADWFNKWFKVFSHFKFKVAFQWYKSWRGHPLGLSGKSRPPSASLPLGTSSDTVGQTAEVVEGGHRLKQEISRLLAVLSIPTEPVLHLGRQG